MKTSARTSFVLSLMFSAVLFACLAVVASVNQRSQKSSSARAKAAAAKRARAKRPAKPAPRAASEQARLSTPPVVRRPQLPERYDQPREAAEFFRLKRLPEGATELPVEKYFEAQEQMLKMPQYSTAEDRLLPARAAMRKQDLESLTAWTPLGPGNIGGRTRALLIHPINPGVMYAASVTGGVWKTTNGGSAWTPVGDLLPNIAISVLAMDPKNPEVIYAGTGEGYFNFDQVGGLGIFKTTDGGTTWTRLPGTESADFRYINDLVISPANSQHLYAATGTGVYRSLNGGASWARVLNPLSSLSPSSTVTGGCLDLVIRTDKMTDYLFASCGTFEPATIYRNTDAAGAGAWTAVLSETTMGRTSLALAPSDQSVVYAAAASLGAGNYQDGLYAVFRSTGGGAAGTWTAQVRNSDALKLNTVLFTNPLIAFLTECRGESTNSFANQGWYDNVIAVDPVDPNRVWVGGIDLFRSDDGGVNWGLASYWWANGGVAPLAPQYAHADQHALVFHPNYNGATNQTLFIGNDGGVFRTDNARAAVAIGASGPCNPANSAVVWTSLNNNYGVTQFYHGLPYPDGETFFGGTQDNGTLRGSAAGGANGWKEILGGDGGPVAIDPTNPNILFASNPGRQIKKSLDGGATFTSAVAGISDDYGLFINPFVMDPSDPQRLWTGGAYLWRSLNGATSWESVGSFTPGQGVVSAIAVAPTNANFLLVGMTAGEILRTDKSLTFSGGWPYTYVTGGWVSSLAFDPTDANIAYATYSTFDTTHVWRSTDAGASWKGIDGTGPGRLPNVPVNSIVVDPTNTSRLFVGTDLGVFVSTDQGASWAIENTGFANVPTESLAIGTANGVTSLYAFTHGRGVWRVTLATGGCNSTLTPSSQTFSATGGTVSVSVASSSGSCNWTATSNVNWIAVNSGASGAGNGAVNLTVAPNNTNSLRVGVVTIAGKSFTVTQSKCDCAISPGSQYFAPGGGTGSVSVTANSGIGWQAVSSVNWITINSGESGTGNGAVAFTVAAHSSALPRVGTLTIAGQTFTVTQLGAGTGCTATTITPGTAINGSLSTSDCRSPIKGNGYYADRYSFAGTAGQAVTISITSGYAFLFLIGPGDTVIAEDISVSSPIRIPKGSGALGLPANGNYLIEVTSYYTNGTGDYSITLTTTPSCAYAISPGSQSFAVGGGTGSVNVTAGSGCAWQASSNVNWLSINSGSSSGTGNGTVNFTVTANASSSPRAGTLNIAGQTFTVTQAAQSCAVTPISPGQTINGSLISSDCRSLARGGDYYADRYSFTGVAGQVVLLDDFLESFDNYLYLIGPDGGMLAGADYPHITKTLPVSGTYIVEVTSYYSFGTGNYSLTLAVGTAGCTYEVTPGTLSAGASGGAKSVQVKASGGCQWQALSLANWITLAASSGAGAGAVNFTVAANTSGSPRTGALNVAGRTVTVTQLGEAGNCAAAPVTPEQPVNGNLSSNDCRSAARGSNYYADRYSFTGTAGQTIAVIANSTAFSPYLSLLGPDGSALFQGSRIPSGSNFFGLPASGVYIIEVSSYSAYSTGDYTLRLGSCTFALSSDNQFLTASGGTGTISVATTGSNCSWQAATTDNWITINSGASGTGNGTINFTAAANGGADQRYGKISVAGQTFTLTQTGLNCPAAPIAFGESVSGSLSATDCRSYNRGSSYYADRYTFNGIAGQLVLIDQPAGDFDSYLYLRGPDGSYLDGRDNPRIPSRGYLTLPATGPYIIEVTSYSSNVTGNYTLRLSGSSACSYALSSTSQYFAVGGGAGAVSVNTSGVCAWQATSNADWVTINSGVSGKGSGAVSFTVAANTGGSARTASLSIAGQNFLISQLGDGGSCAPAAISQGQTLTGSLETSDCRSPVRGSGYYADRYSFTGVAGQAVAILANTSFTGSLYLIGPGGAVIAENPCCSTLRLPADSGFLPLPASGAYIIEVASYYTDGVGSYDLTLNATAECGYALTPSAQSYSSGSATGSVNIATSSGCSWTATSDAPWLTITSGTSGKGNGRIGYLLTPNFGANSRTGTISVGSQTFNVTQAGRPCAATPINVGQSVNGTLAASDCASLILDRSSFYTDRYTFSGTAGQLVTISLISAAFDSYLYLLSPNGATLYEDDDGGTDLNSRIPAGSGSFTLPVTGVYAIEVTSFDEEQTGNYTLSLNVDACVYALSLTNLTFVSAGGSGSLGVSALSNCQWTASSNASWITLAANANGTGSGSVAFNVAPNTSAQGRSGTIGVAGQTVTITQAAAVASVSAASFGGAELASESIVAAFGTGLTDGRTQAATSLPLPTTLAGTTVKVRDSAGETRDAPLFFVSPQQVNYLLPAGTAAGTATVIVSSGEGALSTGAVTITPVAAGLFAANSDGQGPPAGYALRVKADGTQIIEAITRFDAAQNKFVLTPLELGPTGEQVFLVLFGTGFRAVSSLSAVSVKIGGEAAEVLYAGTQGSFVGLDQLNLRVPRTLIGRGEVDLIVTINGRAANMLKLNLK